MKKIIFALIVLCGQTVFASTPFVPSEFLAEESSTNKIKMGPSNDEFSEHIDHLMDVQQQSLDNLSTEHKKVNLTQLLTSFTITKSGLFGISTLSTSSNTTLFWNKKVSSSFIENTDEAKSFDMNAEDELSLQMKIDDVTEYLVRNNKVKDESKLRKNLDKVIRRGNEIFSEIDGLESSHWRVGGYRLDLSISASGVVAPFTKVGENVRLWLEWTKPARTPKTLVSTKATRFISKALEDTEEATAKLNLPNFDLQTMYVGIGEDLKAGLFGFGSSTFGFVGHVKFVKKPAPSKVKLASFDSEEDYPVIQEPTDKATSRIAKISSKKVKKGIEKSLKFAEFFTTKADRIQSVHWELSQIREIATITKSGIFGLSKLSSKGVFTFIFNRKKPQLTPTVNEPPAGPQSPLTLIRLSFITVLGYSIPQISNFELRPNVELFWK